MDSIPLNFCCHLIFAPKAKPILPLRARDRSEVRYLLNLSQPRLFRCEPALSVGWSTAPSIRTPDPSIGQISSQITPD
jgi:hypothetical protein